jgi:hypothetical protein
MNRLFLLVAALVAVLAAPLAAPALAATVAMEHCEQDGHSAPPGEQGATMNHQACCVAVDPGKLAGTLADRNAKALDLVRPNDDPSVVSASKGTDPPPPRLG